MRAETVTSASNPKIRNLLLLQEKSRARREQGLFVVEGRRELEHCIEAGYSVRTIFVCPEIADDEIRSAFGLGMTGLNDMSYRAFASVSQIIQIPEALYRKVAYRESTEGIIAEVEYKELTLSDLSLPDNPLIMVLESVEKPGNLGAVLRSADAAKADAVIICDPLTDLYNPNLIRASIGAVFTVPTVACSSEDAIRFLKERDIQILTAQLQDSSLYYDVNMRRGTALVMGTESTGL
ncbi:MAG: RNA methyltransferase, partial [Bacteroidales bacterium]|nr:RNA methyltransferase [Bacteroidales bacterium]